MLTETLTHTTPDGKRFRYTLTGHTEKCWSISADHNPAAVRTYDSTAGAMGFYRELVAYLDRKYPAVTAGESIALAMAA
jgi:hypothetical protein